MPENKVETWSSRNSAESIFVAAVVSATLLGITLAFINFTPRQETYLLYGFNDHRSYRYAYYIATFVNTCLVIFIQNRRMTRVGKIQGSVELQGLETCDEITHTEIRDSSNRHTAFLNTLLWLGLVWVMTGPPWGIRVSELNNHETVHLKGVQAILQGSKPFIDAASSQYGPLQQLGSVLYMRVTSQISMAGFREFWALTNFVGLALIVFTVCVLFKPSVAALINAVLVMSPSFAFYSISSAGLDGFFGWANPLRNIGAILVALFAVKVLSKHRTLCLSATISSIALGAFVGASLLVAQENAIATLGVFFLVVVLDLYLDKINRTYLYLVCIFSSSAMMVVGGYLVPYWVSGKLEAFIENYFHVPLAVNKGYANFDWYLSDNPCCRENFQSLPLFMFGLVATSIGGIIWATKMVRYKQQDSENRLNSWRAVAILWAASSFVLSISLTSMGSDRVKTLIVFFPIWVIPMLLLILSEHYKPTMVILVSTVVGFFVVAQSLSRDNSILPTQYFRDLASSSVIRISGFENHPTKAEAPSFKFADSFGADDIQEFTQWLKLMPDGEVLLDPLIQPVVGDELGIFYFFADLRPFELPYNEQMMAITSDQDLANIAAVADPRRPLCHIVTSDVQSSFVDAARSRSQFQISSAMKIQGVWLFGLQNRDCAVGRHDPISNFSD